MRWTVALVLRLACPLLLLAITDAQDFDYFYFVIQWPGSKSFSRNPCCYPPDGKPMSDFLIHGLWPQRSNGSFPEWCTSEEFDGNQVASIRADLNKFWPSLECPRSGSMAQNPSFWEHEWEKHGTCSAMTQIEYFKTSLGLWNMLQDANFLTALHDYGIDPGDTGMTYDRSLIWQVLNNALWSKFPLRYRNGSVPEQMISAGSDLFDDQLAVYPKCSYDSVDGFHFQLSELWICLDRHSKHPIPCPKPIGLLCLTDVTFHTFRDCAESSRSRWQTLWRTYVYHVFLLLVGFWGVFAKRTGLYIRAMILSSSLLGLYFVQQSRFYTSVDKCDT